ncbi:MAG TPA: hypothetical protein PLJ78_05890 [Anaerolineae bacterium]|nr:hypothetical protein [Anaerolineae bacterium]HQK13457.1 hypothetical protein [Anaerolineae bacterium]
MQKVKFPVLSVVLYVLAGLFVLYTIWAATYSFRYISEMVAADQLVISGNEFEVANFHMRNFAQYAVFAVILFALGRILQVHSSVDGEHQASSYEEVLDDEDVDEDADVDADEAEATDLEQNATE